MSILPLFNTSFIRATSFEINEFLLYRFIWSYPKIKRSYPYTKHSFHVSIGCRTAEFWAMISIQNSIAFPDYTFFIEQKMASTKIPLTFAFKFVFRVRHKGELLLHSKAVLMLIVLLNLVDCLLVLSELILDIHYVKGIIMKIHNVIWHTSCEIYYIHVYIELKQ